jgi:hypothetical protein
MSTLIYLLAIRLGDFSWAIALHLAWALLASALTSDSRAPNFELSMLSPRLGSAQLDGFKVAAKP